MLLVGAALLVAPPVAVADRGKGRILYLGDSLGVGTAPRLASLVPGASIDADTRVGRTSTAGLAVLRSKLSPSHRLLVFDLGTNDHRVETLARNLRRARKLSRGRPMAVFTLNKPGVRPFNRAIRRFAAAANDVTVIDWHSAARDQNLVASDGVHAEPLGYERRAELTARHLRIHQESGMDTPLPQTQTR